MLQTLEAEIYPNGEVKLLEPLNLVEKTRAFVTILSGNMNPIKTKEQVANNGQALLQLIQSPNFNKLPATCATEIDQRIQDQRNAWDE